MDSCIIKTLAYFDIFDYPLTFSELKKYLCCSVDVSDEEFLDVIDSIPTVNEFDGYYYLLGRSKLAQIRSDRAETSAKKMVKARIITRILSYIPTIDFIGVSGSLSMNNASNSDDIDLFFITKKNTLWLTRFFVNLTLIILGQKRKRNERSHKDKICPNMFVSNNDMTLGNSGKSLYLAHEIIQLKSLFDRRSTYSKFVSKNIWVRHFFPNIKFKKQRVKEEKSLILSMLKLFELAAYKIQHFYMRKRVGFEKVSKTRAYFHPFNRKKAIMDVYKLRSKMYTDLLSENLWVESEEARFFMDEKKIRILN